MNKDFHNFLSCAVNVNDDGAAAAAAAAAAGADVDDADMDDSGCCQQSRRLRITVRSWRRSRKNSTKLSRMPLRTERYTAAMHLFVNSCCHVTT